MIYSVQLKLGHSSHDFNQVSMAVLKCMKMAMAIIPLMATLEIIRVPLRGFLRSNNIVINSENISNETLFELSGVFLITSV